MSFPAAHTHHLKMLQCTVVLDKFSSVCRAVLGSSKHQITLQGQQSSLTLFVHNFMPISVWELQGPMREHIFLENPGVRKVQIYTQQSRRCSVAVPISSSGQETVLSFWRWVCHGIFRAKGERKIQYNAWEKRQPEQLFQEKARDNRRGCVACTSVPRSVSGSLVHVVTDR